MCRIYYTVYSCTHKSLDRLHPCNQNPHPLLATLYVSARPQSTPTQSSYNLSQVLGNLSYLPSPTEIFFECDKYNGREGVWVDYCCGKCWAEWWVGFLRVLEEDTEREGLTDEMMNPCEGQTEDDIVIEEGAKEEIAEKERGGEEERGAGEEMVLPEDVPLPEDCDDEEGGGKEMNEGVTGLEVV